MLVQDSLDEYANVAELAGLKWTIGVFNQRLMLSIRGYNDKLDLLLNKLHKNLKDFERNTKPTTTEHNTTTWHTTWQTTDTEQPHQYADIT